MTPRVYRSFRPRDRVCRRGFRALVAAGVGLLALSRLGAAPTDARVVADEIVTTSPLWNSGASPMWCVGAPLIVRDGDTVWASISVRDPDAQPSCNNHWELWRRTDDNPWTKVRQGVEASEREPCPLFLLDPDSLVLSIQPKLLARDTNNEGELSWYCQPSLAVFDPQRPAHTPGLWLPEFGKASPFTQHSYRSVGVDPQRGELLLMVIDHDDVYHPTWRDAAGMWHPMAAPAFPIRACYPDIVFHNRAAHVLAIGDIVEPNAEWKAEKFRVLKRNWDYAFRRIFYAWTPDVAAEGFHPPLEVDSVDYTAGWMFNLDMLVDAQDRVHLLWVRHTFLYDFLRDRFFPGRPNIESVMHAVIENGRVVAREELLRRELPPRQNPFPQFTSGRLHLLPDGRLVAVLVEPGAPDGPGLFVQKLDQQANSSPPAVRVAISRPPPAQWFFTNTPRGGSKPDHELDILSTETSGDVITLRYINVHIP